MDDTAVRHRRGLEKVLNLSRSRYTPLNVRYRFGEFVLDVRAYELRRNGQPIRLARQPMDLLLMLLDRPRELVTREHIAQRLWGPHIHTDVDAGIHTAMLKIRQVLGDSREAPRFVDTVPGKGYRFVAPVQVVDGPSAPGESAGTTDAAAPSASRQHNLPAELTSFVGRRRELAELPGILATSRLLCLTGAGGVGKTRLAVRLARDLKGHFRDGVWLVDSRAPLAAGTGAADNSHRARLSSGSAPIRPRRVD